MPTLPGGPVHFVMPKAPPKTAPGAARWLLRAAGVAALALGAVGVVVPGLPTTPLVLVAAACFARSSPRLHRWLLANRVFGPLIRDWQESRSVAPRTKAVAIATIVAFGILTVTVLLDHTLLRLAVGVTMLAVIVWLTRLPARPTAPAD